MLVQPVNVAVPQLDRILLDRRDRARFDGRGRGRAEEIGDGVERTEAAGGRAGGED